MTDTKLREAARVISDDMQQAGDTYRTWGDNRLGSIMTQWARKLRAALDEPPEQAAEPAVSTYADGIRDAARIVESMPWLADGDVVAEALVNIAAEFKGTSLAESSEPAAEQPPECTECDGIGKVDVIGIEEDWVEGCSRCSGRGYTEDMPDGSRCLDAVPCPDCIEQAPEPAEGDMEIARKIRNAVSVALMDATLISGVDKVREAHRVCDDATAKALATARAQGYAAGVEAGWKKGKL